MNDPLTRALKEPTPTNVKLGLAFGSRINWDAAKDRDRKRKGKRFFPGIDAAALSEKYGMERASRPRVKEGTFKMPKDATLAQREDIIKAATQKFVEMLEKKGWQLTLPPGGWGRVIASLPNRGMEFLARSDYFVLAAGMNPAPDLETGGSDYAAREMLIFACFRFLRPRPVREELNLKVLGPRYM